MKHFSIGDIVSHAWDLAVKHWPIFVLLSLVTSLTSGIGFHYDAATLTSLGNNPDPQLVAEAIRQSFTLSPWIIVSVLLSIYIGYVALNLYVNAYRLGRPYSTMSEAFKVDINQLAIFFAAELVYGLIVTIGLCLFILPGIYLAVRLWYVPLLTATQGATFGEAFSRSWEITRGNFWNLFLMGLTMFGIAILGLCACCVGIFFTEVINNFMLIVSFFVLAPETIAAENTDYVELH